MSRSSSKSKKYLLFALRWTIAVAGIWYVVTKITWRDQALVLNNENVPTMERLAKPAEEDAATLSIIDESTGQLREVPRSALVNKADREFVDVKDESGRIAKRDVLAVELNEDRHPQAKRILVRAIDGGPAHGEWIDPSQVEGGYAVGVPYPIIQAGLRHMLAKADPLFLWAAIFVFPITFIITGLRWNALLKALGIQLGAAKASIINLVGAFYNTFMPGSTGGDLVKAYYAARQVPLMRTRAVMSVLVDRAIGLVALIIMGGAMAAYQWQDPACRQVAIGSVIICALLAIGAFVFFHPTLRRMTGLEFIMKRLPMQARVNRAVESLEIYRRKPMLVLITLIASFPVHMTVVLSATLAGQAFELPLHPTQYWYIVPVIVLAGAIPISPQGAGVMEFFAIQLTRPAGCTVAQAFALTMSIRLVQILWNLLGGIFVLKGTYHTPTEQEQEDMSSVPESPMSEMPATESAVKGTI